MTDLRSQKRLAADIMGCGEKRVWLDPDAQDEVAEAITREDVRGLVEEGIIREKRPKGVSRGRARERDEKRKYGHGKGPGTRKGKKGARNPRKDEWKSGIRALRKELRRMKDEEEIDPSEYRDLYAKAKGGEFDSVRYLKNYVEGMEE
ncbi:MAG: 50S ribosomal protein L19e [Halobacteriales archaeon]|nr:50S ribosomal protein L19e [Halobacteriales archaeon]